MTKTNKNKKFKCYKCEKCKINFFSKKFLDKHLKKKNPCNGKNNKCIDCDYLVDIDYVLCDDCSEPVCDDCWFIEPGVMLITRYCKECSKNHDCL